MTKLSKPVVQSKERQKITRDEWLAMGERLYGKDTSKWKFKCVQCGNVQTLDDFVAAGLTPEEASTRVYFSCLGRVRNGVGCNWSLGGLFQIHNLEVFDDTDNTTTAIFDFAGGVPPRRSGVSSIRLERY